MVIDDLPQTRASRVRRQRNPWPYIVILMALIGAIAGMLIAQH